MLYPYAPCSDLRTRQIRWIPRRDQLKNGSIPSSYIHWGVSATIIAAQFAEAHASEHKCPISGWRSVNWG